MQKPSVVHATFVIERAFPAPIERVFAAFADPAKKLRWFGEGVHTSVVEFEMDFREGGTERLRLRFKKEGTLFPGVELVNNTSYLEIVPTSRIVTASTMSMGGKRISASLVTIELLARGEGTDLICTHQGAFFEGSDGPQIREQGWQKLFERLAAELAA